MEKKLQKETDAGRVVGPFEEVPLPNFRVPPIKVAPKKVPGEYRSIHNLLFPYDEKAVNTSIPRDKVSVQYSAVDDAISHIKEVGLDANVAIFLFFKSFTTQHEMSDNFLIFFFIQV